MHQVREDSVKRKWICQRIKNRADKGDYQRIVTHQEEVDACEKNFGDNFSILFYFILLRILIVLYLTPYL